MKPYFVLWLVQALLEWIEEDHTKSGREASACQAVPKPTEAFHTFRMWLCRCLDTLGQKEDV